MNRSAQTSHEQARAGYLYGIAAYGLWGVLPAYFKAMTGVAALDIVMHRILWSLPFLALLLTIARRWAEVRSALGNPRTLRLLALIGKTERDVAASEAPPIPVVDPASS